MMKHYQLRIGDASTNGQVKIVDKDRLCYIVYSQSKGAKGLRTISQQLLDEYVEYFRQHPKASADDARNDLCGQTDIDKFEYGYTSTLTIMAKMVLNPNEIINEGNPDLNITNRDNSLFRRYTTAIQSKPFVLLAGISGTGKSRIVRQLAYATGGESPEKIQKPYNISGDIEYKTTDFLRFLAKAWYFEDVPFFLCLDEMNLAPVEQYFAEYLSVLETRKQRNGRIVSDPLFPPLNNFGKNKHNAWVGDSILNDLFGDIWEINGQIIEKDKGREAQLRETFRTKGICLPPNLIVMGTVNMDETTFSFSRKVLDRAMTFEMNDANLEGGLTAAENRLPAIEASAVLPYAVEAMDVYEKSPKLCDTVIKYLSQINETLKGSPFRIAYRTRNEAILYVLANMQYAENDECYQLIQALDEVTNMKILSRIEGDKNKLMNWEQTGCLLDDLAIIIQEQFSEICRTCYPKKENKIADEDIREKSISLLKLKEMKRKLDNTYYCSFWS